MWVSLIGSFVFLGLTFWKRKSYPTNLLFLAGFTAMEAYSISVIVSFTDSKIVLGMASFARSSFLDTSWWTHR
jgi:FtsH-binding integral membrane protein